MKELLPHDTEEIFLFQKAKAFIRPVESILDVGCGIRPQNIVPCKRHICMEPHAEYAEILEKNGYEVVRKAAPDGMPDVDTIVALDVIEHMTRGEGLRFIAKAMQHHTEQIVIFTPLGFMPQIEDGPTDAWGYQGQEWQRHRSGWTPEDFPGWQCVVQESFHNRSGNSYGAFFAIFG